MDFTLIASDRNAEREGRWFKHPKMPMRFKVRRINNPAYLAEVRASARELNDRNEEELTEEESAKIAGGPFARHILAGWESTETGPRAAHETEANPSGVTLDGEPLPYNTENAERLLTDARFQDLLKWLIRKSTDEEAYRVEAVRAEGKG